MTAGLIMAIAITGFTVAFLHAAIPTLQFYGGAVGAAVSGVFLWTVGVINLVVLMGILSVGRELRSGRPGCRSNAVWHRR